LRGARASKWRRKSSDRQAGAFRVEAPVPTARRTALAIRPDRFHDSVTLYFDAAMGSALPPLVAGERDVGELRVARTGALRGRVLDTEGRPIADAEVGLGTSRSTTLGRDSVRTEADGSYVVAHAPVGTYGVRVKAERHVSHFEPNVVVEAGRETDVVDVVLTPSPTIEGRVVDELGGPVEGAKLYGWPVGSGGGSGAGAKSDADGRFVIHLPQLDPYTLSAKLDGYLTWGDEHDDAVAYEGGRRGIEVVLRSLPRTRFLVVDAGTGAPVERFGLTILADNGSRAPVKVTTGGGPPSQSARPGGAAEATARVGVDAYRIAADGYVEASGDVEQDSVGVAVQTVRMQRGVGLRGRVLRDGAALGDVAVELVKITGRQRGADGKADLERHFVDSESRRVTRTDADGRFAFDALEPREFRLTVRPVTGAPLVRAPVVVQAQGATDLGDLVVETGATIVGELLVPAGFDPVGCVVRLDDRREGPTAFVDGTGKFRFEDVPVGVRFLAHEARLGSLAGGEPVRVELAPGETRTIVLDARENALSSVELRIDLGDLPVEGCRVALTKLGDFGSDANLGTCDSSGRVRGAVRALGRAGVLVWLPGDRRIRHPDVVLDVAPMLHVDADVRFEFARLELKLPVPPPRDGSVEMSFAPTLADAPTQFVRLAYSEGKLVGESAAQSAIPGGLSIGGLLAGPHALTVEMFEGAPRSAPREDGSRAGPVAYHRATASVDLVAGRTLAIAP